MQAFPLLESRLPFLGDKKQSTKLWYPMILLCHGDAAQKRRTISDRGNGLECWRVFFSEWEPRRQNRVGNLLLQILNARFQGNSISEIESWEGTLLRAEFRQWAFS